jgi:hypothetical protein
MGRHHPAGNYGRLTTVQLLSELSADRDLIKARADFNKLSDPAGGKLSTYTNPADLTPDDVDAVRLVLNTYEQIAIGIQFGVIDLKIIKLNSRGTILRDWQRAGSFIHKLRAELGNPNIYFEFENLALWLKARSAQAEEFGQSSGSDVHSPRQTGRWQPEAATWAMMLAGFGLVGGTTRRRATRALPAA